MVLLVTVAWFASVVARFANPERYPIPSEVHYAMTIVLGVGLGVASWRPGRHVAPPPPPVTKEPNDGP